MSSFVPFVKQRDALPAGHGGADIRGDAFHFGPVRGFLVARIAQHHAFFIEGVQVAFLFSLVRHR
jgi:hypothetical protein